MTSVAKLIGVKNIKKLKAHKREVVKRATQLYSDQLHKAEDDSPKTKSLEKIKKLVKKQFDGVEPSACSMRRYVNEYLLAGNSPIKRDNPGLLPHCTFEF